MSDDFDDQLGPSGLIQACHEGFDKVAMWLVLTKVPKGNSGSKTRKSKEPNGLVRTLYIYSETQSYSVIFKMNSYICLFLEAFRYILQPSKRYKSFS